MKKYLLILLLSLSLIHSEEKEAKHITEILNQEKVDWVFIDVPFPKVINFIRDKHKINIVLDPKVRAEFKIEGITIHFEINNLLLKDALQLLLHMHNLNYHIRHGVLLIVAENSALNKSPSTMVFHDMSGVALDPPLNYIHARCLLDGTWLPYSLEERKKVAIDNTTFPYREEWAYTGATETIKTAIAPETWDKDENSIDQMNNHGLLVVNTPEVQKQVVQFLERLKDFSSPPIPMQLWCLKVSNHLLMQHKLYQKTSMKEDKLNLLLEEIQSGHGQIIAQTHFVAHNRRLIPLVFHRQTGPQFLTMVRSTLYSKQKVFIEIGSLFAEKIIHSQQDSEKIAFSNFASCFLLPYNAIHTVFLTPLTNKHSLLLLMRVSPKEWQPTTTSLPQLITKQEIQVRKQLREHKVSMNFKNTSLDEVTSFLSNATKINMIVDIRVHKEYPDLPIDLMVSNIDCESILNLLVETYGLSYAVISGVVVISTKNRTRHKALFKLYDLRDLRLSPQYNFFATGKYEYEEGSGAVYEENDEVGGAVLTGGVGIDTSLSYSTENITDLIKNNINKASWDQADRSIDTWGGILLVRQTAIVHNNITQLLDYMRKRHRQDHQMITLWAYLAKSDKSPQLMTVFSTCNRQKINLKSGVLFMGNTAKDKEQRKLEIEEIHMVPPITLSDRLNKRESIDISVVPLIKGNKIEIVLNWKSYGPSAIEQRLIVPLPVGNTVAVAKFPNKEGQQTLFMGAKLIK